MIPKVQSENQGKKKLYTTQKITPLEMYNLKL